MQSITLELVLQGTRQNKFLPITSSVQKYVDNIIYSKNVTSSSIPIVYFEQKPMDSWRNVKIVDKTYVLPENVYSNIASEDTWVEFESGSYTSIYKEMLFTNKTFVDENGAIRPLFWKHKLPKDTVEAYVDFTEEGNKIENQTGLVVSIEDGAIYTNYQNFFDRRTGSYKVFFVVSCDNNGVTTHELLNLVPTTQEATWEDIILTGPDAGKLYGDRALFQREDNGSSYTFYLNLNSKWYAKPLETSVLKVILPTDREPDSSWRLKITNGEFTSVVNGKNRRYSLPEYDRQPFAPYKPYIYAPYKKMLYVNNRILSFPGISIGVDSKKGRHLDIYSYDENGLLKTAYTTNASLQGKRAFKAEEVENGKNVFYEADKIVSIDNKNGFVLLSAPLDPDDTYYASFYFESKTYDYNELDLNPLQNREALDYMYVFYVIPDLKNSRAINYLKIDRDGKIVYCSQQKETEYLSLQMFDEHGSPNSNNVIGMKYNSLRDSNSFLRRYCAPYNNEYAYYVLAEIVVADDAIVEDSIIIDVRREGNKIVDEEYVNCIVANHKIQQSQYGYGPNGLEMPMNSSIVIEAPITLLEDYGGFFKKEEAEILLKKNTNQAVTSLIQWVYTNVVLSGDSTEAGKIDLTLSYEGPDLIYHLYRKVNPSDAWEEIDTIATDLTESITYQDIPPDRNLTYYYMVRVEENEILLPDGKSIGIKVRQ